MFSCPRKSLGRLVVALAIGCATTAAAQAQAVDPNAYPKLTAKEQGQLRHLVKLSSQLPGDWSGIAGNGEWEYTEHYLGFHAAFSIIALAMAQQEYTPAYREQNKEAIERLLAQLTHSDVWERWVMSSRLGTKGHQNTDMDAGWIDPVGKDNNMLKGYLLLSGSLYEKLYGDPRYQNPGAFTFKHWGWAASNGTITYRYKLGDIARIIHQEVLDSNYVGSACEPGTYFWACNSASNVGMIVYDQVHGTKYSDVVPLVKQAWITHGGLDPKSYSVGGLIQMRRGSTTAVESVLPAMLPMTGGYTGPWAGFFNNAWDPALMKAAYSANDGSDRDETLKFYVSGDWARLKPDANRYTARLRPFVQSQGTLPMIEANAPNNSVLWGFYLAFAAEMNDKDAVAKLLAYAERNFGPVWQNGEYYYPRNDDYSVDAKGNVHGVVPWTGNVFLTLGRLNKGDGLRNLIAKPWTDVDRAGPEIVNVNATTTNVSQARWDPARKSLIVSVEAGPVKAVRTTFKVLRLNPQSRYAVTLNGRAAGTIGSGSAVPNGVAKWGRDGFAVSLPLGSPQTIILREL